MSRALSAKDFHSSTRASGRGRTDGLRFTKPLLYQLSYGGIIPFFKEPGAHFYVLTVPNGAEIIWFPF